MAKYMYLFRGGDDRMAEMSNDEREAHMGKWSVWMKDLAEKGVLLGGEPLGTEGKRVLKSGRQVLDGPYTEGKEIVGGYLIVDTSDMDEAVSVSTGCPIFELGAEVEVRPIIDLGV